MRVFSNTATPAAEQRSPVLLVVPDLLGQSTIPIGGGDIPPGAARSGKRQNGAAPKVERETQ